MLNRKHTWLENSWNLWFLKDSSVIFGHWWIDTWQVELSSLVPLRGLYPLPMWSKSKIYWHALTKMVFLKMKKGIIVLFYSLNVFRKKRIKLSVKIFFLSSQIIEKRHFEQCNLFFNIWSISARTLIFTFQKNFKSKSKLC